MNVQKTDLAKEWCFETIGGLCVTILASVILVVVSYFRYCCPPYDTATNKRYVDEVHVCEFCDRTVCAGQIVSFSPYKVTWMCLHHWPAAPPLRKTTKTTKTVPQNAVIIVVPLDDEAEFEIPDQIW